MKKKILVIQTFYFPYVGGAEIATREVFRRLAKYYDIELITARHSLKNRRRERLDGINVIRTGTGIMKLDKMLFPVFAFFKAVKRDYDLLFCVQANQSAIAGNLVNIFRKTPSVLNVQAGFTENDVKKKLGIFRFVYNWVYSKKYYYQVISKFLGKRCISHGISKERIRIVPNGFDSDVFTTKEDKNESEKLRKILGLNGKKVIITTSRLSKKNGIRDVIKSLQYLGDDFVFLVLGAGELEENLKELTGKLGLEKRVKFLGKIDYQKIPGYLHVSDVFIRPSLSEGFGNSFIEAMGCGIPVIGTKVGGIPDFIEDKKTGMFVKVKNPEDIAEKIKMLVNNAALRSIIIKQGLELAKKKYTWDKIAKEADNHFKSIIKNG